MGITCKQAVDYISKKEEAKLTLRQSVQLKYHLAICRFCKSFERQNKLLASVFKRRSAATLDNSKTVDKKAIIKALEEAEET